MARLLPLLVGAALFSPGSGEIIRRRECGEVSGSFHDFSAKRLNDSTKINFSDYAGKVVLVYNVATYCGLTVPSYSQINALAEFFYGEDLVILGFPCNQFGLQEPGIGKEILNGISHVRPGGGFEPKMTIFKKTEVNGKGESHIYTFLKSGCDYTDTSFMSSIFYSPVKIGDIHWNFEKFLIDKTGKPYARYHPSVLDIGTISKDINFLLGP